MGCIIAVKAPRAAEPLDPRAAELRAIEQGLGEFGELGFIGVFGWIMEIPNSINFIYYLFYLWKFKNL